MIKTPRFRPLAIALAAAASMLPLGPASVAHAQDESFSAYMQQVAARARAEGISQRAIDQIVNGLNPSDRVIALDRDNLSSGGTTTSTGFSPLSTYLTRHNTQARIDGGVNAMRRLGATASQVSAQYGVPASIIVAIWGHETAYGAVKGNFDLPQALATLAWEGRRRALFEPELIATMRMVDQGVSRSQLTGSYAGAFGNPQFLPTVYLQLAVDGDGDGDKDIWNSDIDTLHSVANYFRDAGWRAGQPWGVRAYVPNSLNRDAVATDMISPVCPRVHGRHTRWMTVREWRALGVEPRSPLGDDVMASLFEPDGPAAPGYLLTQNYRVILEYNCSNYYAMSVGLLADEISR